MQLYFEMGKEFVFSKHEIYPNKRCFALYNHSLVTFVLKIHPTSFFYIK